jgi:translocation and assembly module TamB
MRSGDASAQLDGERVDGSIRLRGSAQTRLAIAGRPGLAQLSLAGSWGEQARTLLLDRVGLRVAPVDGEASGALETVATGRLDWDAGELRLLPVATDVPPVLAIDGQGIRVSGIGRGSAATRLEGGVGGDLATADALISKWSGRPALGLVGHWSAIASATGEADGLELAARLKLDEPSPSPEKKPTSLAIRAHYLAKPDRLDLAELTATTPYGTLDAAGSIHGPFADRTIDLHGNLAPDFAAITAFLGRTVEPRASLEGKPRAFRASGSLDPSGKGLEAEAGFEIVAADVYGLKLGPTPIVIRAKQGKYSVDPIATTLNSGHIRLEPEIDLEARDGPVLRLAKNSAIRDAAINDAVSRRFLAFVAPVLEQATTASGFVSVDLDHAEFPLGGGEGRHAKVEGAVVFEDVEFAPGPLASDLLGVIGRREARLKLDQPVTLTIADGRVNQRGLAIPVGDLTRIELAGWVDFDRNLSLNATLPVTPAMLGNNEILSDIAAGTRVKLPIRGTLDHPRIDREALAENLKETARSLLTRGATRGALELLMRMSRPRDPDAPPPPTAEERREKRLEKKAERKAKRQGPPPQDPQPGPGER